MEARSVAAADCALLPQLSEVEEPGVLPSRDAQDEPRRGQHLTRSSVAALLLLALLALTAWSFAAHPGLRGRVASALQQNEENRRGLAMHLARDARDVSNASDSTSFNASIADGKSNSSLAKRHEKHPPSMTTPAPTPSPTLQPTPSRTPQPTSPAQLFQFYIYRAASAKAMDYEFGNINVGNAEGVVWYLQNEVVTNYNAGAQCPRKFDISQINRYKVKTRATKELFETGVNFGVRYSYDFGQCMGRCLPGNQCTGKDDCDYHYDKFGYTVGCNKFADGYPFPPADVHAPNGIWYSLPLEGRCEGEPTGDSDCTWSYEDAGVVTLEELEAMQPWGDNCCNDKCTGIWDNPFDDGSASWRVQMFQDKFEEKYPEWPRDLWPAPCDFWKEKWYTSETDWWEPRDPWAEQRAAEQAAQWVERDDENER